MSPVRIVGIVLLVVGVILLYMGFNATESIADQVSETVTGRYTENTTLYLIAGAAAAVGGLLLAVLGRGKG